MQQSGPLRANNSFQNKFGKGKSKNKKRKQGRKDEKVVKTDKKGEKKEDKNKKANQTQKTKIKKLKFALKKAKKSEDHDKIKKIEQQMMELGFKFKVTYTDQIKQQLKKWVFGEFQGGETNKDDQLLAVKHFNSAWNQMSNYVTQESADYIYCMVAESSNNLEHADKIKLMKCTTKILKVYEDAGSTNENDSQMAVDAVLVETISEKLAEKIATFLESSY